jgi:hypothetical protein
MKTARGDSPCPLPVALHAKLPCPALQAPRHRSRAPHSSITHHTREVATAAGALPRPDTAQPPVIPEIGIANSNHTTPIALNPSQGP